jgi:hypothetical protein
MKYQLEKYHGISSRHECPQCHDKHSFAYYVDDNNNIIDESVGRCNHESGCGYHYTPKQFFSDNLINEEPPHYHIITNEVKAPDYIDKSFVLNSFSFDNQLFRYLCGMFSVEDIKRVGADYAIGATKSKCIIYWQVDFNHKIRTGKIIRYDEETGHRIKDGSGINWVHALMKKRDLLPDTFNLVQCLFGEWLLSKYPDKPVALVEAEKTALIGAMALPQYNWLATGGKSQMSFDKMKVLKGKKVTAFPDVDGFQEWKERTRTLNLQGLNISVSDILEREATPEQREKKIDIADLIIEQLKPKDKLSLFVEAHPAVSLLINKLDLEVVA